MGVNLFNIVLADNHALFRRGIKALIEGNPELQVVAEVSDGLQLMDYLKTHTPPPDMVIMEISMPKMGGIKVTEKIKERCPRIKVLILTLHKDKDYMDKALAKGADGYLPKHEAYPELFPAISTLRRGDPYICPSMREIAS